MAVAAPRAVLFDLDDTLADRAAAIRAYAAFLAADFAPQLAPCSADEVHAAILACDDFGSRAQAERLAAALRWRRAATAQALLNHWAQRFGEAATPFPDVADVLAALAEREIQLGLITNGGAAMQRSKIEALGLEPAMDVILISSETGLAKPDPDIFNRAVAALRCTPEEAWFVGDHADLDARGAHAAGLRAFWLRGGRAAESFPEGITTLERLSDLLTHLPTQ
jgi:putative hydrolase of the HAD superfamily